MWVWIGIVVDISHDLASGRSQPDVARMAQSMIGGADDSKPGFGGNGRSGISRAIVHHDHFIIWIIEFGEAGAAIANGSRAIVAAHDDRDSGPGPHRRKG